MDEMVDLYENVWSHIKEVDDDELLRIQSIMNDHNRIVDIATFNINVNDYDSRQDLCYRVFEKIFCNAS